MLVKIVVGETVVDSSVTTEDVVEETVVDSSVITCIVAGVSDDVTSSIPPKRLSDVDVVVDDPVVDSSVTT